MPKTSRRAAIVAASTLAVIGIGASPAFATQTYTGIVSYSACLPGKDNCTIMFKTGWNFITGNTFKVTSPRKDGYIFNCTRYGVPQDSHLSQSNLNAIEGAKVTVTWDRGTGVRDSVVCL